MDLPSGDCDAPALEVRGLAVVRRPVGTAMRTQVLSEIDLCIGSGESVALLGLNGSGKSTLIKAVLGLIAPARGTVRLFGEDARRPAARRRVGFLPESPVFFPYLTPEELLRFSGRLCGTPARELPQRIDRVSRLLGLGTIGARRIGACSKGERLRVGLAQAILHEPDLVILDEPGDGLDLAGEAELGRLLGALRREQRTALMGTHRLEHAAAWCDRAVILDHGRIAACWANPLAVAKSSGCSQGAAARGPAGTSEAAEDLRRVFRSVLRGHEIADS